ncbi:MAG: 6-bladed beta-propeller [Gemmatimonadota bacterium]
MAELRTADAPRFELGCADGAGCDLNGVASVAVVGAHLLVANARSQDIRIHTLDGAHVRTLGQRGQGPGEYAAITWMRPRGSDAFDVYDPLLYRTTHLTVEGTVTGTLTVAERGDFGGQYHPPFENGGQLVSVSSRRGVNPIGAWLDSTGYYMLSNGGGSTPLGWLGATPRYRYRVPGTNAAWNLTVPHVGEHQLAVSSRFFVVGDPASGRLEVWSQDGRPTRAVTLAAPAAAEVDVTFDDFLEHMERRHTGIGRDIIEEVWPELDLPSHAAHFGHVLVDEEERIWVSDYPALDAQHLDWRVLTTEGVLVARARTPAGFGQAWVANGLFLGLWRDELDVEYVRPYELRGR